MTEAHLRVGSAPFVKWAGGKRWLARSSSTLLPRQFKIYHEPFLGGGAMFFAVSPSKAVLSDTNEELINCYKQIKKAPHEVFSALQTYARKHGDAFYYKIRATISKEPVDRAARFLYLNRSCFNGIYRVNLNGTFNVPKGDKNTIIFPGDDFEVVSAQLRSARLKVCDFQKVIDGTSEGDFCFCDPPYTVTHNINGFIKYNECLFSWEDQIRLRDSLLRAQRRGVYCLSTNADHQAIRDLYADPSFRLTPISRNSVIGGAKASRGRYTELLVANYPLGLKG